VLLASLSRLSELYMAILLQP